MKYSIVYYETPTGKAPFRQWLISLNDSRVYAKILTRLQDAKLGNLGHIRGLRHGIFEFKIHYGPGYRIYFAFAAHNTIVLLCAGTKRTQDRDIERAKEYWASHKNSRSNS